MCTHDLRINVQERLAHIAGKGKIRVPVSAVMVVIENAANAARFTAMRQIKIFIAPLFETRIIARVMAITRRLHRAVKNARVRFIGKHRRQVRATAKPGFYIFTAAADNVPRVHMHGGHQRRAHMRDQGYARRPETRIAAWARHLRQHFRCKFSVYDGYMHAGFFKHPPVQHRHFAAAARFAPPGRAFETPRREIRKCAAQRIFQHLELCANAVS